MGRLFVIGDIHGCARELETLLAGLPLAAGDTLVCVGDYIDRGPDSRRVIDLLLALRRRANLDTVYLRGNHEDMCLGYLGRGGHWGEAWQLNGGIPTLKSYGIDPRLPGHEVLARLPREHVDFLESLQLYWLTEGYLVVHAGIRPDRPLPEQDEEDLLWIREDFIRSQHPLPETVVFGHTPQRNVLVDLPYKIGIDTGCVYGGALTGVELREGVVYQVRFGDQRMRTTSLPAATRERRSSL